MTPAPPHTGSGSFRIKRHFGTLLRDNDTIEKERSKSAIYPEPVGTGRINTYG
jgi:hypothetical protein